MKRPPDDEILKVEIKAAPESYSHPEEWKRPPWSLPGDPPPNYHVIEFNVRNNTNQEQAFRIMSCSYYQHWEMDSKKVHLHMGFAGCGGNGAMLMTLKPGESYSNRLAIVLAGVAPGEVVEFRMSFTPYRKERIKGRFARLGPYWSNVLTIKAVDRKP